MNLHNNKIMVNIHLSFKNPKKTNITVGCIYCHLHTDLDELNDYYINNLLNKLSKENKTVFRLGDSNLDLFKYEQHSPTDKFCNTFSSDNLLSHIIQPARINLLPMALLVIFT